jgi:hypothetical protein
VTPAEVRGAFEAASSFSARCQRDHRRGVCRHADQTEAAQRRRHTGSSADQREATADGRLRLAPGGGGDSFDLWLRRSLHEAFGAVAAEPILEEILRLIEEDRAERERIRRRREAAKQGK